MKVVERWYRNNYPPPYWKGRFLLETIVFRGELLVSGGVRIFYIQQSCHDATIWTYVVDLELPNPQLNPRRMAKAKKFGVRNPLAGSSLDLFRWAAVLVAENLTFLETNIAPKNAPLEY